MSLTVKSTDNQKEFVKALHSADRFNSFKLGTREKIGPWKKNATELLRQITAVMADIDFNKLYECGQPKKGDIYPLFTDNVLNESYYAKKVWRVQNGKKYYICTNAGAKAIYARIHALANAMGLFLEIDYEPGNAVKQEENDDGTTTIGEEQISSQTEIQLSDLIETGGKRQIILTGAPGTGKTYTAKMIAKGFIEQGNDFYAYYRSAGAKVVGSRVKDAVTSLLSDTTFREGVCGDVAVLRETYRAFDEAYVKEVCNQVGTEEYGEADFWMEVEKLRGRLAFVQFHPSYDYTDFVEGLRPVEKNGTMQFERLDGSFMSFCRFVAWQNKRIENNLDNLYFFIIDEINRADLSKVLGELMFCLEEDKRGKENRVFTQYRNLKTYFSDLDGENAVISDEQKVYRECFDTNKGGFYIPENVVIIGTMNDIDRSVTSMDFALRRRFVWEEVEVTEELLSAAFSGNERFGVLNEREGVRSDVISRTLKFNTYKCEKVRRLNKDFDISQGQFINLSKDELDLSEEDLKDDKKTADAVMGWVWKYRIRSLMKEYLRGETNADGLLIDFEKAWLQKETQ